MFLQMTRSKAERWRHVNILKLTVILYDSCSSEMIIIFRKRRRKEVKIKNQITKFLKKFNYKRLKLVSKRIKKD